MTDRFFLVLEGLDGSGKSEVSRRLAALLIETLGADRVLLTYEPHDPSAAGEYCRDVLAKRISVSARTLALAFALNRADHVERVIAPFLDDANRRVVICDRYLMSSLVYQSTGGLSIDDVADLNRGAPSPDLTLFLDVTPEVSEQRIGQRQDHRELFEERLAETRQKYFSVIELLRARGESIAVVDANGTLPEVINGIVRAINAQTPAWLRLEPIRS